MPRLRRPDGEEIDWRMQGAEGPLVAITLMAMQPPAVCRGLVEELATDHRVLTYDLRGTGGSSRRGPTSWTPTRPTSRRWSPRPVAGHS